MGENNKQNQKEEPLLYIHQPEFEKAEAKMQRTFDSLVNEAAAEKVDEEVKSGPQSSEQKLVNEEESTDEAETQTEAKVQTEAKAQTETKTQILEKVSVPLTALNETKESFSQPKIYGGMRRVKSFREMTIEEKFQYLASFPISQPPYPCEFITENEKHQGFVVQYEQDQVSIKTPNETVELNPNDVKAIRIIR